MSHTFEGSYCRQQRKLAKIWRAIARRALADRANLIEAARMNKLLVAASLQAL
jgi:hypothetical protein